MAKLIYSMLVSLDGYIEDAAGNFEWGAADSEEVHGYFNQMMASVGTFLNGRRIYDTMVFWETADSLPGMPPLMQEFARIWQAADKIVYSRSLTEARSARTVIRNSFDPEAVRQLKASAASDITIDGAELAAQALRAGLVDEVLLVICPVVAGGGKRFWPEGVQMNLRLVDQHRFQNGFVALRYLVGEGG